MEVLGYESTVDLLMPDRITVSRLARDAACRRRGLFGACSQQRSVGLPSLYDSLGMAATYSD